MSKLMNSNVILKQDYLGYYYKFFAIKHEITLFYSQNLKN